MKVTPVTHITPVDIYARRLREHPSLYLKVKRRKPHVSDYVARSLRYSVKVG